MRWQGVGALVVAAIATGAHAQTPGQLAPLSAAVFDTGAIPTEHRTIGLDLADDARLEVTLSGVTREPSGLPALRPSDRTAFEAEGFDVRLVREWPGALRLDAGDRKVALTPHAGVGMSEAGPGAEAGATLSFEDKVEDRLDDLGVRDGKSFGDKGRWYLFAATSGRSVGLNMLRGADGELRRAGWSMDGASALVSDAQVGVGWRKGPMQASVGYLHREIKPRHDLKGLDIEDDDSLVAVTFSFKPR